VGGFSGWAIGRHNPPLKFVIRKWEMGFIQVNYDSLLRAVKSNVNKLWITKKATGWSFLSSPSNPSSQYPSAALLVNFRFSQEQAWRCSLALLLRWSDTAKMEIDRSPKGLVIFVLVLCWSFVVVTKATTSSLRLGQGQKWLNATRRYCDDGFLRLLVILGGLAQLLVHGLERFAVPKVFFW